MSNDKQRTLSVPKKLVFSFLILAAFLGCLELLVRQVPDTVLGFSYDQNTEEFNVPNEYTDQAKVPGAYNSWGMHAPEPQPVTGSQVVLLGDSYVEAYTTPQAHTPGVLLEQELRKEDAEWSVLPLGKRGWNPRDEREALQYAQTQFPQLVRPDIVVSLLLLQNDVHPFSPTLRKRALHQVQHLSQARTTWHRMHLRESVVPVWSRSVLSRTIGFHVTMARNRSSAETPVVYRVYDANASQQQAWQDAWYRFFAELRKTRDMVQDLEARYVIVSASTPIGVQGSDGARQLQRAYPELRSADIDIDFPGEMLKRFCAKEGIELLQLEPSFRELTHQGEVLHWRYDGHWNANGNQRAAEAIGQFIVSN